MKITVLILSVLTVLTVFAYSANASGGHTPAQRDREIATLQRKVKRLECEVSLLMGKGITVTNQGTIRGACSK